MIHVDAVDSAGAGMLSRSRVVSDRSLTLSRVSEQRVESPESECATPDTGARAVMRNIYGIIMVSDYPAPEIGYY